MRNPWKYRVHKKTKMTTTKLFKKSVNVPGVVASITGELTTRMGMELYKYSCIYILQQRLLRLLQQLVSEYI